MAKIKTLDGERTRIAELNTGPEASEVDTAGTGSRVRRWLKNLNMVMAGMYTGLNCYGTPKTHHEYDERQDGTESKPDRRLI